MPVAADEVAALLQSLRATPDRHEASPHARPPHQHGRVSGSPSGSHINGRDIFLPPAPGRRGAGGVKDAFEERPVASARFCFLCHPDDLSNARGGGPGTASRQRSRYRFLIGRRALDSSPLPATERMEGEGPYSARILRALRTILPLAGRGRTEVSHGLPICRLRVSVRPVHHVVSRRAPEDGAV